MHAGGRRQFLRGSKRNADGTRVVILGQTAKNSDDLEVQRVHRALASGQHKIYGVANLKFHCIGEAFSDDDTELVGIDEVPAGHHGNGRADARLAPRLNALAQDREFGPSVAEQARSEEHTSELQSLTNLV